MTRMVVDANYLQKDELRDYLSKSADNKVIVTPYVELEMHKGNALINVLKSTEIIAKHPKQVILTKDPHSINRLNGRKKGLKKRLSGGGRTSTFRRWNRHTREKARCGDECSGRRIGRQAAAARAQLNDMRDDTILDADTGGGKFANDDVIAVSARGTKAPLASSSRNQPIRRSCHEAIRRARCFAKRNRGVRGERDWAINLRGKG